ncbi:putative proteasome endopeptidase complex [Helianthus anomalus]
MAAVVDTAASLSLCELHPDLHKYECNMHCLDCVNGPLCSLCLNQHQNHRHIQVMKFIPEMVIGWYHSHPGFGCWLSGVDINTQQNFEALNQRAVAVVVDPIQSVKG